jgi:hypothetical protein
LSLVAALAFVLLSAAACGGSSESPFEVVEADAQP